MTGHGAMRSDELSTGDKLADKPKDATAGKVVAWGASKLAVATKVKGGENVDAAESASADSEPPKNAKTAAATVMPTETAAIGAGSTAAGDAATATNAKVKPVRAFRPSTVKPAPTAAGGAPGAAMKPVSAVNTTKSAAAGSKSSRIAKSAAAAVTPTTTAAIGAGSTAAAAINAKVKHIRASRSSTVKPAPTAAGGARGAAVTPVSAVNTTKSAAADIEPAAKTKTAAAAVVPTIPAAVGAGSTADGDAITAAKVTVEPIRASRSSTAKPAAGGSPGAAVKPVSAARSGVGYPSGKAPAAAPDTAVVTTAVGAGTSPVAGTDVHPSAKLEDGAVDGTDKTENVALDRTHVLQFAIVPSTRHIKKSHNPARASLSAVGCAQRGSPVTAGGTYSQVVRRRTDGDGHEAVASRPTCASYMAGHGVMRLQELPTRYEVAREQNDAGAGAATTSAWGKTASQVKAKVAVAVDTARSATVESTATKTQKTTAAVVVATAKSTTDAGSTTSGDAALAVEATMQAVGAVQPSTIEPSPTAARGVSEVAVVPVVAAPAVTETLPGQAPAMDLAPAASGGLVTLAAGAMVDKGGQALILDCAAKGETAVAVAVTAAATNVAVQSAPVSSAAVHPAAADVDPEDNKGSPAVGAVDHRDQPADAVNVVAKIKGVPAILEAEEEAEAEAEAEAAGFVDDLSAAVDNFTAAGGGGTVQAEVAVVASEMVAMSIAVAVAAVLAASVNGAPATGAMVKAIDADRPTGVYTSPAATGGLARSTAAPVVASPAAVVTKSPPAPATEVAPEAAGVVVVAARATPDQADQAAAIDVATMDEEKVPVVTVAAIVAIRTDQVSPAGVGPAAADADAGDQGRTVAVGTGDDQGQSAVADVVATSKHTTGATAESLAEAAFDAGDMPAAAEKVAVAAGGDASAAKAATSMVAAEMTAVSVAVAVDPNSTTGVDGPPAVKIAVESADSGRSIGVETSPTATNGSARAATEPVTSTPAAELTNSPPALAMEAAPAATGVMVVLTAKTPADKTDQAATIGAATMNEQKKAAAIIAVHTDQVSAAVVGPAAADVDHRGHGGTVAVVTADDQGQSAVAGVVPGEEQGVPAVVEAAENAAVAGEGGGAAAVVVSEIAEVAAAGAVDVHQDPAEGMVPEMDPGVPQGGQAAEQGAPGMVEALAEAAVDADEMPAAAENAAVVSGGDAAVAAVALQMAVVAGAVAADEPQGPAEDFVAEMNPVAPEAAEAAGAAAEPAYLAAAAGGRTRRKFSTFHILVYGIWTLWVVVLLTILGPTDSTCRGNTLGPNDKPLAPFEHIEGKGGRYRLGWLFPWFGYTPKLAVSASGEMVATRSDGSKVVLAGSVREQKANRGVLCGAERLVRRVARIDTPEYGARSVKGRLVLGREYFCAMDASAAATHTMNLAQQWLEGEGEGEGIVGFSDHGDLEMVTPSGELVWSLARTQGDDKKKEIGASRKEIKQALKERKREKRQIEKENREERRLRKAESYSSRFTDTSENRKKQEEAARRETGKTEARQKNDDESKRRRDEETKAKQKGKGRRKSLFGWNDGAAGDAVKDSPGYPAQGEPPRQTLFGRIFRSARPSPNGAGGQAR